MNKRSQTALEIIHIVAFMTFLFLIIFWIAWHYSTQNAERRTELGLVKECEALRSLTTSVATMDQGTLVPFEALYNISFIPGSKMILIHDEDYKNGYYECLLQFPVANSESFMTPSHALFSLTPLEQGLLIVPESAP